MLKFGKPLYRLFIKDMNSSNLTKKNCIYKNIFYKIEKNINIINSILFKISQKLKYNNIYIIFKCAEG